MRFERITLLLICFLFNEFNAFAQITISGQLKNAPDSTEVLISYFNDPVENMEIVVGNSLLDEAGYFHFSNELHEKRFAKIKIGDQSFNLFLVPGDTIHLNSDYYALLHNIAFESKYAKELEYLTKEKKEAFFNKITSPKKFTNAFAYKEHIDSMETKHLAFFMKNISGVKDIFFVNYKREEIKYIYIHYRNLYSIKPNDHEIPNNYFSFLDSVDLNLPKALWMQYYEQSINALIYTKCIRYIPNIDNFSSLKIKEKESILLIEFNFLKDNFKGDLRDYLLSEFMKYEVSAVKSDTSFINKILFQYNSLCKNESYQKYIRDFYIKRTNLNKSQIPNFEFQTIYGEKVHLHSLKGKYIYIDFWATWCYPCLIYLKDYPSLIEKYKNHTDLVYLFININDDQKKWESYILNKPNYGINWYADKNMSKRISSYFEIDAIPRYIIVDKSLKIMDVDAEIPKNVELP